MIDIIKDTIIDGVKLIPFLFIAFLLIELIEHKFSDKSKDIISKSGKFGPLIGAILGAIPQCGFSVLATNLYVTRIITFGTLISIYLSTSDEMLPILLSNNVSLSIIIKLILIKVVIGFIFGFILDFFITEKEKKNFHICEEDHCDCEESILKSSIIHTLKSFIFILIITFIINFAFEYFSKNLLSKIFLSNNVFAPFLSSLIGLIPTCGASIMISELYINNIISLGTCIAGLLTGSGVAILVLFENNKNIKENITILILLYLIGSVSGVVLNLFSLIS